MIGDKNKDFVVRLNPYFHVKNISGQAFECELCRGIFGHGERFTMFSFHRYVNCEYCRPLLHEGEVMTERVGICVDCLEKERKAKECSRSPVLAE